MTTGTRVLRGVSVLAVLLVFGAAVGCGHSEPPGPSIANPASEYCVQLGGTVEPVEAPDGGQSGLCRLPDGRVVDEWTLYRADHPDVTSTG
ncbi:MAG: DUF333 domain-containing protein [Acidimicrobiia bacterium]